MLKVLNGPAFIGMLDNGIKNVDNHRKALNDLNVFPVPDGDTGTNMVMTLKFGFEAIKNREAVLSDASSAFSTSAVFGARGNSGVIVSQFFKGLSEGLKGLSEADATAFSKALECGCKFAYASVAVPVEGTMLTVIKDGARAVANSLPLSTINEAIDVFLGQARMSLKNTPNLLPILKKANVVDSGASGIVYFFEGVKKYLAGETVELEGEDSSSPEFLDLSQFNKDTIFEFGYCIEGLVQLTKDEKSFSVEDFKRHLCKIGSSVVVSLENDKVKLHVHSRSLGEVISYCQKFGEFLTVKIENMTVQNIQKIQQKSEDAQKFLCSETVGQAEFAIVAVATNQTMQQTFLEMGADVVILSEIAPSSQDFMEAYELTKSNKILVFPNSSNSILTSMQAGSLYKQAKVVVLNSRSLSSCYSALTVIDLDGSIDDAEAVANETMSNMYSLSVYHSTKDMQFGSKSISKNDFFALSGNKLLAVGDGLEKITLKAAKDTLEKGDYAVVTLFYGRYIADEFVELIAQKITDLGFGVEVATVSTYETLYSFTVTFE